MISSAYQIFRQIASRDSSLRLAINSYSNFVNFFIMKMISYSDIDLVLPEGLIAARLIIQRPEYVKFFRNDVIQVLFKLQ